jgi:hypothetical protein
LGCELPGVWKFDAVSSITIVLPSANVSVRTSQPGPHAPKTITSWACPSPVTSPLPQDVPGAQLNGELIGPPDCSGKVAIQATVVLAPATPALASATTKAAPRNGPSRAVGLEKTKQQRVAVLFFGDLVGEPGKGDKAFAARRRGESAPEFRGRHERSRDSPRRHAADAPEAIALAKFSYCTGIDDPTRNPPLHHDVALQGRSNVLARLRRLPRRVPTCGGVGHDSLPDEALPDLADVAGRLHATSDSLPDGSDDCGPRLRRGITRVNGRVGRSRGFLVLGRRPSRGGCDLTTPPMRATSPAKAPMIFQALSK